MPHRSFGASSQLPESHRSRDGVSKPRSAIEAAAPFRSFGASSQLRSLAEAETAHRSREAPQKLRRPFEASGASWKLRRAFQVTVRQKRSQEWSHGGLERPR